MPPSIQEDTKHVNERFVILLYDRTSKCKGRQQGEKGSFCKEELCSNIPPTYAALEQHVKRSALQGGLSGPGIGTRARAPPTNRLGLASEDDGPYTPLWTTLPEANQDLL
ncbi:hypothetical protein GWK47_039076 [Chionoecetes opilio]|uniref:Uncharacterized protein n=1 Tax=Chionoecetes opilio TaxID=41210 RepID=A0A8J4YKF9_CHIOP|nr:hypothetical protein GWK47_039076 [Chionoecetes opilio]